MATGYEVQFYADVKRAARALEKIAASLQILSGETARRQPTEAGTAEDPRRGDVSIDREASGRER